MILAGTLLFVFLMSAAGTGVLRWIALRDGVLDVPNERSSHTVPTPRAGGVAIVVAVSVGALALWGQRLVVPARVEAIAGGRYLKSSTGKRFGQVFADTLFIVNDENAPFFGLCQNRSP